MIFRQNGSGSYWDWKMGEVFEVTGISMGVTLIRVQTMMGMSEPNFKTVDDYDKFWDGVMAGER